MLEHDIPNHNISSILMDQPSQSDLAHIHRNYHYRQSQSDPDSQTARFQGRNSGNGCSAARFLRRNTDLGSGMECRL